MPLTDKSQRLSITLTMEKAPDEEGASLDDGLDEFSERKSEFVEVDPTRRYGRYHEVLGKGAYKTVYKAFDDLNGIEVAWNQVKIHDVVHSVGDMERLFSELHLLKTLKHRNIIKFHTSWVDTRSRNVNFITEIFTSGTLRQYRKKHRHVNLKAIKHWSCQILRGLVYLHSRDPPIIHRDLKCDNIFINGNNGEVKIGDLGLATILRRTPTAQSVIGTPEFMAPELYEEHYNELVDIYSFGMCLLEMLTSEYPYSECTNAAQIYRKVTTGKKPAVLSKICDPETRMFVEKCIGPASERLQAKELLMDPFLRSDEDLEIMELRHHTPVTPTGFGTLDPIPENSHTRSIIPSAQMMIEIPKSTQRSSLQRERSLGLVNSITVEKPNAIHSSITNEGSKSSKDFRIKGRKQDDKKVLVRIRIASSGGEIRVIQFDFDVEVDTAVAVANEMVTELDLSDQDVVTIADMIDAEITALIPDWKPGLAFVEAVNEVVTDQKEPIEEPIEDKLESKEVRVGLPNVSNQDTTIGSSDDQQLVSGPGPTYGRFEEVGCTVIGSDIQQEESDGLGFFSDFSSQGSGTDSSLLARSSADTAVDNDSTVQSFKSAETDAKSNSSSSMDAEEENSREQNLLTLGSDDKLDDYEVGKLMIYQEEELQIMRSKHELALRDLKMRISQNTSRSECKGFSSDISVNELVLRAGSSDMPLNDIKASELEINSGQVKAAASSHESAGTVTRLSSQDTLVEKSRQCEGSFPAENASTVLVTHSDLAGGENTSNESVGKECVSKPVFSEVAALDGLIKKAPITHGGHVKRAVAEVAGTMQTESKPSAHCLAVSRSMTESNGLESRLIPAGHEDAKPDVALLAKRESYLELYKASNNKDSLFKSKSSELVAKADGVLKAADANQEQLKKQQVEKSIADLEAKTLQNLAQAQTKYCVGVGVKNHSGVAFQNGQQGAATKKPCGAALQTCQQGVSVKNLSGSTIQNSQQGLSAKIIPCGTLQSGQQCVAVKNVSCATIQNGQPSAMIKNPPGCTIQNTHHVGLKSQHGAILQNGQNGQQSAFVKNSTASGPLCSAVKSQPAVTLQNSQQSAMGRALAGASSQQVSTAEHARQQHMLTETSRA